MNKYFSLYASLIVYATAIVCGYWYWSGNHEAISAWAIALTGAVIIWYTWETKQLRREAFFQREVQLRPFIVFQKAGETYIVENIGNGAALDLRIDTVKAGDTGLEIRFPHTLPLLKQHSTATIKIEVYINGNRVDDYLGAHLDPRYAILDVDVKIHFSNIEGKRYTLVETISPKTLSIKGFHG